ncbi:MAG TPA: N-acetyl-gamma-glutamyl-phosphate reductase [Acidimicrobiales bacterium]|nr:N-acetyl-gamma-glutamyl-phosphate reductase [Acidimicrobiales bacterium]
MKAAIVGGSGYLGAELLRLLAGHPELDLVSVQADSAAGRRVAERFPGLAGAYRDLAFAELDPDALAGADVVFVAVPSGRSQAIVPRLLGRVGCVVDLGADFRLKDAAAYPEWYGFDHAAPELLAQAVYGLPERFRSELGSARLVAAPGCYVTAAALALAPLVDAGAIDPEGVVVDAASGTSGAGGVPSTATHHSRINESFDAYGLLTHRHTPEIEQATGARVLFTPHHAPMTRGILASCYARAAAPSSTEEVLAVLRSAYEGEAFVHVVDEPVATRETYAANIARITARHDTRTGLTLVMCAIDNITKGGAGQAIQAANVALGIPETSGLPMVAVTP